MGTPLTITTNLDISPWDDLEAVREQGKLLHGMLDRIGILPGGVDSGQSSVAVTIKVDGGRTVVGETTLALFVVAARALLAAPLAVAEGHIVDRCLSCDHPKALHHAEGCWYTVTQGRSNSNLVCPCNLDGAG